MSFNKVGMLHCERCGKPFTVTGELLTREALDDEEESKQAGFCSSRCLYQQNREDNDKKFITDYKEKK